jgi:glycyl-tRNA synthetase
MEMEFFVHPNDGMEWFERWRELRFQWHLDMGLRPEKLRWHEHGTDERAHYAKAAWDIEYEFPFGWNEFEGIHHRGDYDLSAHSKHSGKDLAFTDPDTKERYVPHVVETSIGVDRCMLALLSDAYTEDEIGDERRVVLKLSPKIAPVKAAVFPLTKKLVEPARRIVADLRRRFQTEIDISGSIGRRYRRQDEIGTPYCVTYDPDSETDQKVTVRDRDTTEQERIAIDQIGPYLSVRILGF